jgi:hypothetical protein
VHHRALGTFFAQDDITFLAQAAGLERANWLFRPLSQAMSFRLAYLVFGLNPWGYHLINLILHVLNTAGVFGLVLTLGLTRGPALAAAVLFGVSSIAFTPLHWAAGVTELLSCTFLLAAMLVHLSARSRPSWQWGSALLALAAMFSKETAVAWVIFVVILEARLRRSIPRVADLLPAVCVFALFIFVEVATKQVQHFASTPAYGQSFAPGFLLANLSTYVSWSVGRWNAIPDRVAAVDWEAWRVALPAVFALGAMIYRGRRARTAAIEVGLWWWLVFLLPVLPLAHHTYLYYLYVPWVGAAVAAASLGTKLLTTMPQRIRAVVGLVALLGFVLLELRNIDLRATQTADALPVDRAIRDATLLRNALPALRAARLPPGTAVGFVNPVPGRRFDLLTGAATQDRDLPRRLSYFPLEAAMREGETLRLFLPQVSYAGFYRTIPLGLADAEWFYFEQRGWLRRWGRGQQALLNQARVQMEQRAWAAAETTFREVRSLGDTLPEALAGQAQALTALGRYDEAERLAQVAGRRWPNHPAWAASRALSESVSP